MEEMSSQSLADTATNQIIQLIIENDLKPGSRLPNEFQLAQQLGIGRSTLREAIRLLVARNVLEVRQGAGTFVSKKRGIPVDPLGLTFKADTPKLAVELFDIRLMLEPNGAALAALHATEEQMRGLEQRCLLTEQKILNGQSYFAEEESFHSYLASCSGNSMLETLIPMIVSSIYMTTVSTADRFRESTRRQHRQIVNAVCRRDSFGASLAMAEHLNMNREFFASQL